MTIITQVRVPRHFADEERAREYVSELIKALGHVRVANLLRRAVKTRQRIALRAKERRALRKKKAKASRIE